MFSLGSPSSLPYKGKTIAIVNGKRIEVTAFQLFLLREKYGTNQEKKWVKVEILKDEIRVNRKCLSKNVRNVRKKKKKKRVDGNEKRPGKKEYG